MRVYTVGHSTRPCEELIDLLQESAIDLLVDVRSIPRSRTNPQFNVDALPPVLAAARIGYRHLAALGGLRGRPKGQAESPNSFWTSAGFRNYADYACTPAFRAGLTELAGLAQSNTAAIMCAESLWWRCHRRIIADYMLAAGVEVVHIMGPGTTEPARLTPEAVPQPDGSLHYPAAQGSLL